MATKLTSTGIEFPDATVQTTAASGGAATTGWTHLGTVTTTSGNSQTLSGLDLSDYKFLRIVYFQVSSSSVDEKAVINNVQIIYYGSSDDYNTGFVDIDLTNGVHSSILSSGGNGTNNPFGVIPSNGSFSSSDLSTSSTSLTFSWTGSVSFNHGSIRVYGI